MQVQLSDVEIVIGALKKGASLIDIYTVCLTV
jgi:hypothetical protein